MHRSARRCGMPPAPHPPTRTSLAPSSRPSHVRSPTLRLSATQRSQRDDREVGHSSEASQQSRAVIPTTEAESRRQSARPAPIGIIRESEQSQLFRVRNSVDLLFYHLELRRFIVFELKTVAAEPEHIGKLNFYVNVVDDRLRRTEHGDRPTIGILLAADRDDVAVRYYLRGLTNPLAVSTYRALPDEVRPALPSADALADLVRNTQREIATETAPPGS